MILLQANWEAVSDAFREPAEVKCWALLVAAILDLSWSLVFYEIKWDWSLMHVCTAWQLQCVMLGCPGSISRIFKLSVVFLIILIEQHHLFGLKIIIISVVSSLSNILELEYWLSVKTTDHMMASKLRAMDRSNYNGDPLQMQMIMSYERNFENQLPPKLSIFLWMLKQPNIGSFIILSHPGHSREGDILLLSQGFTETSFAYIKRDCNRVAHNLAREKIT